LSPRERDQAIGRNTEPDLLCDRSAQISLQVKDVGGLTIVRFGPHLHLIAHANQSRCDAQPAAVSAKGALHKIVSAQLLADSGNRLRASLVDHRRGASDDVDVLGIDLPKRTYGLLGQT